VLSISAIITLYLCLYSLNNFKNRDNFVHMRHIKLASLITGLLMFCILCNMYFACLFRFLLMQKKESDKRGIIYC